MVDKLICVKCGKKINFQSDRYICEFCGASYSVIDNIPSFIKHGYFGDGFDPEMLDLLSKIEREHFWHKGRREIIHEMIKQYGKKTAKNNLTMLELGCGNGNIVQYLKKKAINIEGADISLAGLKSCKKEADIPLYQVDILRTPFCSDSYDIVGLFDIIEHLDDDVAALKEAYRICKKNGIVIITVPANSLPWSYFDDISGHKRRYSKDDLISKIKETGFRIEKISFFMFFLSSFLLIFRQFNFFGGKNHKKLAQLSELKIIPIINELFLIFLKLENLILKKFDLPFGSSIICVARKYS